jgi:methylthioribose-1-phosphate isomerase
MIKTLYFENGVLNVLDQRLIPHKAYYVKCRTHRDAFLCIKDMIVRGAPAIGVCAGYGMLLACIEKKFKNAEELKKHLSKAGNFLISARPTAVNLAWAVNKMLGIASGVKTGSVKEITAAMRQEADRIYCDDIKANMQMGKNGAALFKKKVSILTHCNAGALATAGWGTAVGVIRSTHAKGKIKIVYVDETRPYLQGMRLTAWELKQDNIPCVLISDNMAGYFMSLGSIDAVIVGADRIASNGDTANKIGTYSLSVLSKYHGIPFYVAAPVSTVDMGIKSGKEIKIEMRNSDEVVNIAGKRMAPVGVKALHPAFDVTPGKFITAIITEKGVVRPPFSKNLKKTLGR